MNCNNYNTIKVTAGNAFSLLLPLKEKQYVSEQPIEEVINAALLTDVQVLLNNEEWSEFELGEDGVLVHFPSTLSKGVYNIELTAKYGGIAIRAAYFQCLSIVSWSYQSDAENYIPTSPLVADAAFVISVNGDEELTALKEQYRNAIAATEAEKAEYERKVAELDGVAKEESVKEILEEVKAISPDIVSSKELLATAITSRGGESKSTDTLAKMAEEVYKLPNIAMGNVEFTRPTQSVEEGAALLTMGEVLHIDDNTITQIENPLFFNGSPVITANFRELEKLEFVNYAPLVFHNCMNMRSLCLNKLKTIRISGKIISPNTNGNLSYIITNNPILKNVELNALESIYNYPSGGPYLNLCFLYNLTELNGELELPELTTITSSSSLTVPGGSGRMLVINKIPNITSIKMPKLQFVNDIDNASYGSYILEDMYSLEKAFIATEPISVGDLYTGGRNGNLYRNGKFAKCPNLIDITIGQVYQGSPSLHGDIRLIENWLPTNVLADPDKVAIMNRNIREHIAVNCAETSATINFAAGMQEYLEEETLSAFTNKGWTVSFI